MKNIAFKIDNMFKKVFITALVLFLTLSCERQNNQSKLENIYTNHISTFIETCWNKKNLLPLNEIVDNDSYTREVNNVTIISNLNELEANMKVTFTGFPDLFVTINEITFNENKAYLHWTFSGTNTGVYGENPATGKKVLVKGFTIVHYNTDGQIFHEDVHYNELELLQQLGYILTPPNVE